MPLFFFLSRLVLFSTNARSLPSPLTSLTLAVCQGFTSKLMIGFLTVQQAVFYPALCEETKIISMNMEKPACMVISNPVISISVKLTWLNLTYIQTDGDTLFESPLGSESHCKHWLWLMCINIQTCQGCWLKLTHVQKATICFIPFSSSFFFNLGTISTSWCKVYSPWFDSSIHHRHSRLLAKWFEAVLTSFSSKVFNFNWIANSK